MKKRVLSLVLLVTMVISMLPIASFAEEEKRISYNILLLDVSADANFVDSSNNVFYTSKTEIDSVKKAAISFANNLLSYDEDNKLAVVAFNEVGWIVQEFTNNIEDVNKKIESLNASGDRTLSMGFSKVGEVLDSIKNLEVQKNVILFSTGFTNVGPHSYSGHYDTTVPAATWENILTKIELYAYANTAYAEANYVKKYAKVYSVGFFQNIDNIPVYSNSREIPELFRMIAKDMASSDEYFYAVENPSDIENAFSIVAEEIKNGFEFYSNRPSLFVTEGDEFKIAVRYKEEDIIQRTKFGISCSMENKTIADIVDSYANSEEIVLTIKAKKPRKGNS